MTRMRPSSRPHGQIRQSQVVTTFGPGAVVDLPNHSVLIAGLEFWNGTGPEIHEPRLVAKAQELIGASRLMLHPPPPASDDPTQPANGITVFQFPEWFVTQGIDRSEQPEGNRSRLLVHRLRVHGGKVVDEDGRKRPIVPIRFVRACRRGHIGDIDWYAFVHRGDTTCRRQLRIDERGTSGDLSEAWVRCDCGQERPIGDAAVSEFKALGKCDGVRPWLGPRTAERCDEWNRLLVRTASNAYFPQILSVIALPEEDEGVAAAIRAAWEHYLQYVDSIEQLREERRRKPPVTAALEGFTDEQVFDAIRRRKSAAAVSGRSPSVKQAEIEVLTIDREEIGFDRPDGDFYARRLPRPGSEPLSMRSIERVVLVHRLREVMALIGFSRFEPISPDIEGELDIGVRRAALAREIAWLPAVENRGEGIFILFDRAAVTEWENRPAVLARGRRLVAGFERWKEEHRGTRREFPGLAYVMLHSLSHLLLSAIALECGYPASSIRERIYASPSGYGVLLYTASSDAEGTLGGLVESGKRISSHLPGALDSARLCSNDPVCAQHDPWNEEEHRFLLGAACHGCLLIAETSCENHNDYLDRALVVPTLDDLGAEFFPGQ